MNTYPSDPSNTKGHDILACMEISMCYIVCSLQGMHVIISMYHCYIDIGKPDELDSIVPLQV